MRKLLSSVLVVFLLASGFAEAAKKKSTPIKTAGKRVSGKTKKASASRTKRSSRRTAARLALSRPTRPTPERYMEVQQALADKGFYRGPIDGVWSAECVQALKEFQESENLTIDGKLGARSIIALGLGPQRSADTQFMVKPPVETADDLP